MGRWLDESTFAGLVARLAQRGPNPPPLRDVREICKIAVSVLSREPNVLHLDSPLYVVGDIHGQFQDLLEVFRIAGPPPSVSFLFLGDYVDRGVCGVETMMLLLVLKLRYPTRVHLLRGNHEQTSAAKTYGFYQECLTKYGTSCAMKAFSKVFDVLPLAAVVDGEVFCVHGGVSPLTPTVDHVRAIDRTHFEDSNTPMGHLLWSDPGDKPGFHHNTRGAGPACDCRGRLPVRARHHGHVLPRQRPGFCGPRPPADHDGLPVDASGLSGHRLQRPQLLLPHGQRRRCHAPQQTARRARVQARERPATAASGSSSGEGGRDGMPPRHPALRDPLVDEEEREEARRLMDASPLGDSSPRNSQGAPDVEDVRRRVDTQVQEFRALSDHEAAERLGAARMFLDAMPTPSLSPHAALVGGVVRDAVETEVRAATTGLGYHSAAAFAPSPAERTRPPARLKPLARKASPHGKLRSLRGGDALDGVTAPGHTGSGLLMQYFADGGDSGEGVEVKGQG